VTDPNLTQQVLAQQITAEIPEVSVSQTAAQAGRAADAIAAQMSRQDADHAGQIRELTIDQAYAAKTIPVSARGSGGYSLTPAEIHQQYEQCTRLLASLENKYLYEARLIANAKPPAPDVVASVPQATAVAALGQRAITRIKNQVAFLTAWQAKLEQAKERYLDQEHLTQAQWVHLVQEEHP
jgi:hypothetical protein